MGFNKTDKEKLLVATGRRCCICRRKHKVSLHHIVPREDGGTDDIDNAIPLCPNCHDEVHTKYSTGRVTLSYSPGELQQHKLKTIEFVSKGKMLEDQQDVREEDKKLILFYAQCLDRPAFRTSFHSERSFADFDKAMEDTVIALNTGYWRLRDGTLIERYKGKACIVNPDWRKKLDEISSLIDLIRTEFRRSLNLDEMLCHFQVYLNRNRFGKHDRTFRHNSYLGDIVDEKRQRVIEIINSILLEIGHNPLPGVR